MSWVRIWIHFVFSTKNRIPYLNSNHLRFQVFEHIKENAQEKGIWLDCINGYEEHCHCLVALGKEQTASKVALLLKGESSFWINKNRLTRKKFIWQNDYYAVGVSEGHVQRVRNYIHRQEEHHKKRSYLEEWNAFIKKYNFEQE